MEAGSQHPPTSVEWPLLSTVTSRQGIHEHLGGCLATLSLIPCLVEGLYSAASFLMTSNLAPSRSIAGALHDCTDLGSMLLNFHCDSVLDCLGIWGWAGKWCIPTPCYMVIFGGPLVLCFIRSSGDAEMPGSGHPFARAKTAARLVTFNAPQHRNEQNQNNLVLCPRDGCLPLRRLPSCSALWIPMQNALCPALYFFFPI